jgi:DNA-binding NarL/FixJ family response regulator
VIRVVVVDDQELVRTGLATMVSGAGDIEVVGDAADGRAALDVVRRTRPDVVLMDIRMPVLDGLAATRELLAAGQGAPRVLVLTTFDADEQVVQALQVGASGFLLKDVPTSGLIDAIRAVHAGDMVLSPGVTRRVVERHLASTTGRAPRPRLDSLTPRELDVLRLVTDGATNLEVAATLHLSESTVKTHVGALLAKLRARDRVRLVIIGHESGLASSAPSGP